MSEWEQDFEIDCPTGGEVTVGVNYGAMPVGGQVRFQIPAGKGVPAPVDSGWLTIADLNGVYGIQRDWGPGVVAKMSVAYRPGPGAYLAPFIAVVAQEPTAESLAAAERLENWTKWEFPVTGPAEGDIAIGVACHLVGVGSEVRFTTDPGDGVPGVDCGVRQIQNPSESLGITQHWPAAHSTVLHLTFAAAGGLPDPASSLEPFIAQVIQIGKETRLKKIWSQVVPLVH